MAKKRNKLGWVDVPLNKLHKAPWNYKKEDEDTQRILENNLKAKGQIINVIIRELDDGKLEVVNGNHRLTAFHSIDWKDKVHCFHLGKISKADAEATAISTNELNFEKDPLKLASVIEDIAKVYTIDEMAEVLPYSKEEIHNYQNLLTFEWNFGEDEATEGEIQGGDTFSDVDFTRLIKVVVTEETFKRWNELKKKMRTTLGYDNESKVIEFAIIEALNIPDESIQ